MKIYKIEITAQNLCFVQSYAFWILNFNENHNFLAAIVENLAIRIWWSLESILWNKVSARGLETNLINLRKISRIAQQLANIISKDVSLKPNLNVDIYASLCRFHAKRNDCWWNLRHCCLGITSCRIGLLLEKISTRIFSL